MIQYRYYIPYFLSTVAVHPITGKLKYKYQRIQDSYTIRKKLTNSFVFKNDAKNGWMDFNFLYGIETNAGLRCTYAELVIEKSCNNGVTWQEEYRGKFTMNSGKWDLDKCTFETELEPIDRYTCLLDNQNKEINILESSPQIELEMKENQVTVEYMVDYPSGGVCPTHTGWTHVDSYIVGGVPFLCFFARETYTTANLAGSPSPPTSDPNWYIVSSSGGFTTFARPYTGSVIRDEIVFTGVGSCSPPPSSPPATVSGYSDYVYVTQLYFAPSSSCVNFYFAIPINGLATYSHFRDLQTTIEYIVQQICPTINGVVSDFFEWNPVGDAPGYSAGNNYVTGLNNIISKIAISQKSDIINPTASNPATKGMITFKKLMAQLNVLLNVWYFVDSNLNLRIEHDKYFTYSLGYDSTAAPHAVRNIANKKYTYDKESLPSVESFKCMEQEWLDFVGTPITYSGACVNSDSDDKGKKDYTADIITTDINYIQYNPADIAKLGFVLAVYYLDGSTKIVHQEAGKLSGNVINNAHLSWANLHYNYHRYNRVLAQGYMNGILTSFFTYKRIKQQENVKLVVCCDESFEPTGKLVRTELGDGEVIEGEEENNIVTLTIAI